MEWTGYSLIYLGLLVFATITLVSYSIPSNGQLNTTLQIATLSIFLVQLLFTLMNYQISSTDRQKSYYSKYMQLTQKKLDMIDKLFMNNRLLDKLYAEMYAGNPEIDELVQLCHHAWGSDSYVQSESLLDRLKAEHHASLIIFQVMADVFMIGLTDREGRFDECEDLVEWKETFQKWMRSEILQKHWKSLANEYHPKFQNFMKFQIII